MKGFIVKIIEWSVRIIYNRIHTVSEGDKKGGLYLFSILNIINGLNSPSKELLWYMKQPPP